MGSHISAFIKKTTEFNSLIIDNRAKLLTHTHQHADDVLNDNYASDNSLSVINKIKPVAIIHCAANSLVEPSVLNPKDYYQNNVTNFIKFLDNMKQHGHKNIIFSSSSSVYGDGDGVTASKETDIPAPCSPYGTTKLIGEMILKDYYNAYGINSICFRYFNAVGSSPELGLGQEPNATHLIAKLMESIIDNKNFYVYGNDYSTIDGTCIRDYVHVADIAEAHIAGMNWLFKNDGNHVYNIGSSKGYSVKEIVASVEKITNKKVNVVYSNRRAGDSAWRVADIEKISSQLNWKTKRNLDQIVHDAYKWYTSNTFSNIR